MGKLIRNGIEYGGGNGTDIFEVTQAEYNALKQAGTLVRNALYVISDAENLNPTASDIEYSSGVTVKTAIDNLTPKRKDSANVSVSANDIATFTLTVNDAVYGIVCGFAISSSIGIVPLQVYFSSSTQITFRVRNIQGANDTCDLTVFYI